MPRKATTKRTTSAKRRSPPAIAGQDDDLVGAVPWRFDPARDAGESRYDAAAARRVLEFFPRFLSIDGRPYQLPEWQARVVRALFGWRRPNRRRRFRQLYLEVPRGNSKTMLLAGLALYCLFCDGEAAPEVYLAAADRAQAGIAFEYARRFVEASPPLAKRCRVYRNKVIEVPASYGVLRALSSDAPTKHGLHGSAVLVDELHAHPSRELFETLVSGIKTRQQPLVCQITTAGTSRASICYEQHQYAAGVVAGSIADDSFLPVLYTFDESRDDWQDPAVWRRLNPNWGATVNPEEFERDFVQAKNVPAKEAHFRQTALCQWVDTVSYWLPMSTWDEAAEPLEDLSGRRCWAGLDLSSQLDLTALSLVFRDDSGREPVYTVLPFFFLPEETARRRAEPDAAPYLPWAQAGYIELTPGSAINEQYLQRRLAALAQQYQIEAVAYDPWRAAQLVEQLDADGFVMVEHKQNLAAMSPTCQLLEALVVSKRLRHGGHPVLRWNAANTKVYVDPAGNVRPHKGKSGGKIDGIIATLCGLTLARQASDDAAAGERAWFLDV